MLPAIVNNILAGRGNPSKNTILFCPPLRDAIMQRPIKKRPTRDCAGIYRFRSAPEFATSRFSKNVEKIFLKKQRRTRLFKLRKMVRQLRDAPFFWPDKRHFIGMCPRVVANWLARLVNGPRCGPLRTQGA
jgi:hypothetical protein